MRRIALALVLLLAPTAIAAPPAHVDGQATFGELHLDGWTRWSARHGALDLAPATREGEPFVLSWTRATGTLFVRTWNAVEGSGGDGYYYDNRSWEELRLDYGAGSLRDAACAEVCEMLLVAEGDGEVSMAGAPQASSRWLAEPRAHWAVSKDGGLKGSYRWTFAAGTLAAGTPDAPGDVTPLASAVPSASGRLLLFVQDATVVVDAPGGGSLDTLARRDPLAGLPGLAQVGVVETRFAVLTLEGVSFPRPPTRGATLLASAPEVALQGTLRAASATGHLTHQGRTTTLDDAPLEVDGELLLRPVTLGRSALPGGALPGAITLRASFDGEATRVKVGAATLGPAPAGLAEQATIWAAAAAVLGAVAWAARAGLAPFYSRITRDRALANANRARIRDLVAARPGITAAQLRRATGLARVVVSHHLRVLREHGLVVAQRDGRRRRYVVPSEDPAALPLRALLEDETRRTIFDALAAAQGPLTQKDLMARTGLSQRLVSYHLAKLAAAGAVAAQGTRPIRYAMGGGGKPPGGGRAEAPSAV